MTAGPQFVYILLFSARIDSINRGGVSSVEIISVEPTSFFLAAFSAVIKTFFDVLWKNYFFSFFVLL